MSHKREGQILKEEMGKGLGALRRSAAGLFVSGLSGGLDVGFSLLAMGIVVTIGHDLGDVAFRLLLAGAYAIGFVFVVLGRSELFTEQTTLAVLPVLGGRAELRDLLRLWGVVYVANVIGAATFAGMIAAIGPALGVIDRAALGEIARSLTDHSWLVILASAALAGWLMGLMSWLVTAGRDTVSQIIFVILVTGLIGLAGLHHAVLGTAEVLGGLFAGEGLSVGDFVHFLAWTSLGNALGGTVFVALLKYTHAIRGARLEAVDLGEPGR